MLTNTIGSILYHFHHLELWDYLAFVWFFALVFLFVLLGFMLLRRHLLMGFLILTVMIIIAFVGPFFLKFYLNDTIRKNKVEIVSAKQLHFSDTFIIKGTLTNLSKQNFSTCKIYIGFYAHSKNKYKQYINDIFPYAKVTKKFDKSIQKGQSADFKHVLNNFKIKKDANLSAVAECYK